MFEILKIHLENNGYDNHIYYGLTNDELIEIKNLLQNDYGYIDLIMDFSDLDKLNPLIESIPQSLNNTLTLTWIYAQYISYKILKQIHLPEVFESYDVSLEEMEKSLFSGDLETFRWTNTVLVDFVDRHIRIFDKRVRVHMFLDEINNKDFQKYINLLLGSRMFMTFMGYTNKEQLLTYYTLKNQIIESPHDYRGYYKEDYYTRLRKKNNFD